MQDQITFHVQMIEASSLKIFQHGQMLQQFTIVASKQLFLQVHR